MLGAVMASLKDELFLEPGIPGGMEGYRSSLVLSLFFKFYLDVRLQLEEAHVGSNYNNLYNNYITIIYYNF